MLSENDLRELLAKSTRRVSPERREHTRSIEARVVRAFNANGSVKETAYLLQVGTSYVNIILDKYRTLAEHVLRVKP